MTHYLYNIYFPNGGSGPERHDFKQKFLKNLTAHLKFELATGKQIIVVGDYNVAHREVDVYDPIRLSKESGFLPEERAWMSKWFESGFTDAFRYANPLLVEYSWWSYRAGARVNNKGWRIDYLSVSDDLRNQILACRQLPDAIHSDHCPVWLQMKDN